MRRLVVSGILLALAFQGTAASAAPISGGHVVPLRAELAANLATIDLALTQAAQHSFAIALLTGGTARYNAIHAAAPVFKRNAAQLVAPATTHISHAVAHTFVSGSRGVAPQMVALSTALQTHSDPLALHGSSPANGAQATAAPGLSPAIIHPNRMTASPTSVSGTAGGTVTIGFTCSVWNGSSYDVGPCTPLSSTTSNAAVATATTTVITYVGAGSASVTFHGTGTEIASVSVTVTAATPPPPTPTPPPTAPPTATPSPSPAGPPPAVTGFDRWHSYETNTIPGVGRWFTSTASGNLIVQDDVVSLPERGIDLAERLTYNSKSAHDVNNSDGSVPSNYGNGWTAESDAHLAYYAATNTMVISDVDGAAYTYSSSGSGGWTPPPGIHSVLAWTGACSYTWTKRGNVASPGTVYEFYSPIGASCVTNPGNGYRGRLQAIYARANLDSITFLYSWSNGDASNPNNIASVTMQHSDGQALTLNFADFSGHRLLASVVRPDGASATFSYSASGNLTDVYDIGNNAATGATPIHHQYGYAAAGTDGENGSASGYMMQYADGANWVTSGGASGAYVAFAYDGNSGNAVSEVQYTGVVNPLPADGTGTALQSAYTTGAMVYRTEWFDFSDPGRTAFTDSDSHATTYYLDSSGRVTQTQD